MDRPLRIAVVGAVDDRLVGDLKQLPLRPDLRVCRSLLTDSDALLQFQPDVLVVALTASDAEEIGALRLLRQLWPTLGVLVVSDVAHEVAQAGLAQKLRALLLVHPDTPGQLAALVEQARLGSDRPRADTFVDLARGVADEINNPLMFVSGHLQLLRANLQAPEQDRRDQISAALDGLQRIATAIERLRMVSQAASGPRSRDDVDLAAALREATAMPRGSEHAKLAVDDGVHVVRGEREQLVAAVAAIVRFADDLAAAGATTELALTAMPSARRLRVSAAGNAVASWHLPHSFEPFYPSRALRGLSAGLGVFLAQTIVLAHRGQATARRLQNGTIEVDFVLPA
jgi:signal transduction histidine kinase